MRRGFLPLLLISALFCQADIRPLPSILPAGFSTQAIAVDSEGNISLAGAFENQPVVDAFVAKLSPDGSQILYLTRLAGSGSDVANAIALGADGSVYITGSTSSPDFPATEGSMQRTAGS